MAPPPASAVESPIDVTPAPISLRRRVSAVETPSPRRSRQVSSFEDRYGMVWPYCGTFEFEWNPNYDHTKDCDPEDVEDRFRTVDPIPTAIKYLNRIRESFGFDVDCRAPSWFDCSYIPVDMSKAKLDNKALYDIVLEAVDFAVAEINSDMVLSGSGKRIELVELVKVVKAAPAMKLLTLRVKEVDVAAARARARDETKIIQAIVFEGHGKMPPLSLEQWRFKPVEDDDFWYKAPPVDAARYADIYGSP